MITTPTVFILGAGASMPYGLPSGNKLLNFAAHNTQSTFIEYGYDESKIEEFQKELRYSQAYSIDAFLETRPELIGLGKAIIASFLIEHEDFNNLMQPNDNENWFKFLYRQMELVEPDDIIKNRISFISFNYDRSLECLFYWAFYSKWSDQKYSEYNTTPYRLLESIQIVHVHGKLGKFTHEEGGSSYQLSKGARSYSNQSYNNGLSREDLIVAKDGIRVIHEKNELDNSDEFKHAHNALKNAKRVIFLGFGFHEENVKRLQLINNLRADCRIYGTTFGLTPSEVSRKVKPLFRDIIVDLPQYRAKFYMYKCLKFFRENVDLLE